MIPTMVNLRKILPYLRKKNRIKVNPKINTFILIYIISVITFILLILIVNNKIKMSIIFTIFLSILNSLIIMNSKNYIDKKIRLKIEEKYQRDIKINSEKNKIKRIIVTNEKREEKYILELSKEKYTIGKSNYKNNVDIDLSLFNGSCSISKNHAMLLKKDNLWYIFDTDSKNGTVLIKSNNRRIEVKNEKEIIGIGDIIILNNKIQLLVN